MDVSDLQRKTVLTDKCFGEIARIERTFRKFLLKADC